MNANTAKFCRSGRFTDACFHFQQPLFCFALLIFFSSFFTLRAQPGETVPPAENLAGFNLTNLNNITLTSDITGEKPQSKVWYHDAKWWAALPNSSGTHIWRLDGTTWSNVLSISSADNSKADCKAVGNVVHILLVKGASTPVELVSLEYVPATQTYQTWSGRPSGSVTIVLDDDLEIATIDIDSRGRMWLASDGTTQINVRYSDSPYSAWNGPVTLATSVSARVGEDDICVVSAFSDKIGVLWSDQNLREFGFKWHLDGADPATWSSKENPPNPFGTTGAGFGDDHLNVAVASDGTIYAAVKTSFDASGYPTIVLLRRLPDATWNSYPVSDLGTRGIVVLNEAEGVVTVAHSRITGASDIICKQSAISSISFGSSITLLSGSYNNVTSTKQNFSDQIVFFASNGTTGASVLARAPLPPVDLRGHWAMEEGSGTTLVDSSAYGNDAATTGSPTWTTGVRGLALNLNGTSQYATAPDDPSLDITDAITLAAWIRPGKVGTQYVIKKAIMNSTNGYELSLSSGTATPAQKVFVRFNQAISGNTYRLNSITSYPGDGTTWMHIAATYDGVKIRIYINGVKEDSLTAAFSIAVNNFDLSIGAQSDGLSPFQGLLDDARVYSRALSGAEIAALATIPPPPMPTFATDGAGRALDFDGSNDYVNCGNSSGVSITGAITMEAWIRPDVLATQSIIKKNTATSGYELSLSQPNNGRVFVRLNGSATYRIDSSTLYPRDGQTWMHVAATYDGSTMKLYVNGVLEGSITGPSSIVSNANNLLIGADPSDLMGKFFNGCIDEARLWNVARTQQQIREFMCRKLTGSESGLVGYWRMDENSGLTAFDETANNNDGSLTNMAENDHVWSGAALGDESAFDYDSNGGYTAALSHSHGDNISATTTSGTISGIHVYRADDTALRPDASIPTNWTIDPLRFWGVFVAGSNTPQYTVVYDYDGHPGIVSESGLRLAVRDNHSDNSWADLAAALDEGANTLTKTGQSGTEYALASASPDNSLPVQLSSFTAAPGFEKITLKWVTESELNNLGFILERAPAQSGPFQEIASYIYHPELRGQGNSNQRMEYAYTDEDLSNGEVYYYRLSDVDIAGVRSYYPEIISAAPRELITEFRLHANYPNPFNPGTTVKFEAPETGSGRHKITLAIYNSLGQEVKKLYDGVIEGGVHEIYWDARDERGNPAASGQYFVHLRGNDYVKTIRMILVR